MGYGRRVPRRVAEHRSGRRPSREAREGDRRLRRCRACDMTAKMLEQAALAAQDPEVYAAILQEEERQRRNLELIASENYVSQAVREAASSVMTNKYAEGYPGKRYYGGCEFVDIVEELAVQRLKKLFGVEYANVQPHSGAQANMAVYFSALKPGDTIMGTALDHGGHLTHGSKVNFSGKMYNVVPYMVDRETERFDYDEIR